MAPHLAGALLTLCLLLTGCGSAAEQEKDCPLGVPADTPLLTVDRQSVPAGRCCYWLSCICGEISRTMEAAGRTVDWSAPAGGTTLGEYAREQVLHTAAFSLMVEQEAERLGCTCTAADRAECRERWRRAAAAHGGEAEYLSWLSGMGLDRESAEELERIRCLYLRLLAGNPDLEAQLSARADAAEVAFGPDWEDLDLGRFCAAQNKNRAKMAENTAH